MRALIATLACLAVLVGSSVAVAQHVDTSAGDDAAFRARAAKAYADAVGKDCGCTAPTRAKDRVASRTTTASDSSE